MLNFGKNFLKNSRQVKKFFQCASIIHFHRQQLQLQPFRPHISLRTLTTDTGNRKQRDLGGSKWIKALLHKILLRLEPYHLHLLPRSLKLTYFDALDAEYARHESARNSLQCFICDEKITGNLNRHIENCKVRNPFYRGEGKLCPELFEATQNEQCKVPFDELEVRMIEHELKDALMSYKFGLFPHPNINLCNLVVYLILDPDNERSPNKWKYVGTSVQLDDRIYYHRWQGKEGRRDGKYVVFMERLSPDAAAFLEYILIQMRDDLQNGRHDVCKPLNPYSDKEWREKLVQLLLYRIHNGEAVSYKFNLGNGRKRTDLNSATNDSNEADAFNMSEEVVECEVEEQQNVEAEVIESKDCCVNAEHSTLDCNESALMRENRKKLELADDSVEQDVKCIEMDDAALVPVENNAGNGKEHKYFECKLCGAVHYRTYLKKHLAVHGILDPADPYIYVQKTFKAEKDSPLVKESREQWKQNGGKIKRKQNAERKEVGLVLIWSKKFFLKFFKK